MQIFGILGAFGEKPLSTRCTLAMNLRINSTPVEAVLSPKLCLPMERGGWLA